MVFIRVSLPATSSEQCYQSKGNLRTVTTDRDLNAINLFISENN